MLRSKDLGLVAGAVATATLVFNLIGPFENDANQYGEVVESLYAAGPGQEIRINIDSYGGFLSSGMPVYYGIKNSEATITTHVDLTASSMGQFILLVGDKVSVSYDSRVFFHSIYSTRGSFFFKKKVPHTAQTKEMMGPYLPYFTEQEQKRMLTIDGLWLNGKEVCGKMKKRILESSNYHCVFRGFK